MNGIEERKEYRGLSLVPQWWYMSSNLSPIDEVSEDMDFSLIEKDESVHIENYFQPIVDEFKAIGMPVEIVKKDKKTFGRVESAFLKENTETYISSGM